MRFLGVDIETTGSDFTDRIKTIQIGVFDTETGDLFRSDIGWPEGLFDMVPEATAIHGFTIGRILKAPSAHEVDEHLSRWMAEHGVTEKRGVAIGFNVGGFDLPFVRRDLPEASRRLSYRSADLNAICFALAAAKGLSWMSVKETVKKEARLEASIRTTLQPHDAAYDAMEAVYAYRCLVRWMKGPEP